MSAMSRPPARNDRPLAVLVLRPPVGVGLLVVLAHPVVRWAGPRVHLPDVHDVLAEGIPVHRVLALLLPRPAPPVVLVADVGVGLHQLREGGHVRSLSVPPAASPPSCHRAAR